MNDSGRRFQPKEPVKITDVQPEDKGEGWHFSVHGLHDNVKAARFRSRAEAERAHRRLKRAFELLGHRHGR